VVDGVLAVHCGDEGGFEVDVLCGVKMKDPFPVVPLWVVLRDKRNEGPAPGEVFEAEWVCSNPPERLRFNGRVYEYQHAQTYVETGDRHVLYDYVLRSDKDIPVVKRHVGSFKDGRLCFEKERLDWPSIAWRHRHDDE
jgi:hypothetical protein